METIPTAFRDLLEADLATLATVGTSGRPQQSIVWFLAEGDVVRISLSSARQKTFNLKQNPACSVLIADPASGYRYLELRGHAKFEPDAGYTFAGRVGAKYHADLRRYDGPEDERLVVTVVPERVRAVDMRS